MFSWSFQDAVRNLRDNKLTEIHKMRAFTYLIILLWISVPLIVKLNWLEIPTVFGPGFFITIFGILWCFKANSEGDNQDFITRMVCLSWITILKNLFFGLPIIVITGLIVLNCPESSLIEIFGNKYKAVLTTVAGSAWYFAYFVMMRSYILYVSGAKKTND